jgi:outer membrane protein assembly factor BamB
MNTDQAGPIRANPVHPGSSAFNSAGKKEDELALSKSSFSWVARLESSKGVPPSRGFRQSNTDSFLSECRMMKRSTILLFACFLVFSLPVRSADWPQFRGPHRDGVSQETGLLKSWPKEGPKLLWTYTDAGVGYSGPAVVGERLYLMGARGDTEFVFALGVKTAKELWSTKIGPIFTWQDNRWNAGPSAIPTVDGELLFALGGQGELVCVETASGKERWRVNLPTQLGAEVNPIGGGPENLGWGYTWSPLVDGEHLICVPGGPQGTVAALDKKTGKVIWRSKELTQQASYASPLVTEIGGVRQYIILTNEGISGVAAKDGHLLWSYPKEYNDVVIATPIVHDTFVYVSVGYGLGCDLIKVVSEGQKFKAQKVYANKVMVNQQGGVVLVGDHVYGYSDGKGWVCQDFKTGKMIWSEKRALSRGSVTCADGKLYCLGEDEGAVVLVPAKPEKWQVNGRLELPQQSKLRKPQGKVWTYPVIANGRLYLRDQELLFCFDVKDPGAK